MALGWMSCKAEDASAACWLVSAFSLRLVGGGTDSAPDLCSVLCCSRPLADVARCAPPPQPLPRDTSVTLPAYPTPASDGSG